MGLAGLGVVGGAAVFIHEEYKGLREEVKKDMRELDKGMREDMREVKEVLNKKTWWG